MPTQKVNLSAVGDACDQDPTPAGAFPNPGWYVFLNNCDGTPFVHAGKQYGPLAVDHGYVEIKDVPRGRYLLFGIVNPFPVTVPIPGGEAVFQANFASHFAVVDVCECCDDLCITLYNSGWHYCVQVIIFWFELLARRQTINPEIARAAIDAMTTAVKAAGKTMPTDAPVIKQLEQLTRAFAEAAGREQKPAE